MLGSEKVETHAEAMWVYEPPRDQSAKVMLLTSGGIAILGTWRNCLGVIAHYPLPRRNHEIEAKLGLIKP